MSHMKRGFRLDDVDHHHSISPKCVPFAMPEKQTATVTVSIGVFQAEESIEVSGRMTAAEFQEGDLYQSLLSDALDSLNAEVEMFLDDLGERGVI